MDEVVQAATVITAFLFLLGTFHGPCKMHHEFLHDTFNTTRILTVPPHLSQHSLLPDVPSIQQVS